MANVILGLGNMETMTRTTVVVNDPPAPPTVGQLWPRGNP